ncbi:hypothetical protein ACIBI3_03750 [Actinomadura luteofluorescens]
MQLTLSGDTAWELVNRLWLTLAHLWSAIAWDEMFGFDIKPDAPKAE